MDDIPLILEDYLNYMETIRGKSPNTVKEYFFDIRIFLRFLKIRYRLVEKNTPLEEIEIYDIDIDFIKRVTIQDLHAFISFVDKNRGNGNSAKARKVASIRSFFDYLHTKINLIEKNPANNLEFPKTDNRQPVYLTLEQAKSLLDTISNNPNELFRKRDYAIVTLFLNCGLRLSELVSIDIHKIKEDTLTVIGKGNKERTIYLNDACKEALNDYIKIRPKDAKDEKALFLSKRKNRISTRAVQHMIDKYLEKTGLDPSIYSTHKLRHTAATLMYKYGNVDIRALQDILGHENVATTQIYTHIDDERLREAVNSNPLSHSHIEKEKNKGD
ncbi:tyrosine recombinase XerC [Anaerosalibacter bizertensis]|nr:tyrosine recombinase XerC [Anaerosalibacter bizertensis]MBV1818826.1 tyrosine recombinase XerC [Bacteroidales bacterium MSK.15.36]MCB5560337.1 tyrosine recombinase XerC [Anaerosalibacter bizertensis]MCG4566007.1 tyrosine recombinase XerC [Anaerosalibacter bizertensis]MCG4583407.1 tyrosine recombinase XerC [Anaerosalibacter bizertensis]MCG4585698.1 tyrosine recombinase XerC [Anaerosalibacter bizertensis]